MLPLSALRSRRLLQRNCAAQLANALVYFINRYVYSQNRMLILARVHAYVFILYIYMFESSACQGSTWHSIQGFHRSHLALPRWDKGPQEGRHVWPRRAEISIGLDPVCSIKLVAEPQDGASLPPGGVGL